MDEEIRPAEIKEVVPQRPRPLILTLLCLFTLVYFALLTLLFLAGLFNTGRIAVVMNQYMPAEGFTKVQSLFVFLAGFTLHGLAFTGVVLIWNLRKTGYYLLGLSCLIIAAVQLLNPTAAITSTAVYIIILFLFGLFFRRMH